MAEEEKKRWQLGDKCTIYSRGGFNPDRFEFVTIERVTKCQVITTGGKRWWSEEQRPTEYEKMGPYLREVGNGRSYYRGPALLPYSSAHALTQKREDAWKEIAHWNYLIGRHTTKGCPPDLTNKELSAIYKATRAFARKLLPKRSQ